MNNNYQVSGDGSSFLPSQRGKRSAQQGLNLQQFLLQQPSTVQPITSISSCFQGMEVMSVHKSGGSPQHQCSLVPAQTPCLSGQGRGTVFTLRPQPSGDGACADTARAGTRAYRTSGINFNSSNCRKSGLVCRLVWSEMLFKVPSNPSQSVVL